MRLTALTLLALASLGAAQMSDNGIDITPAMPVSDPAADAGSGSDSAAGESSPADQGSGGDDSGTGTFTAPPTQDTSLPWNITYFIVPTRNNYWVNDAVNSAQWTPVNVPTNIMLSNSNSSVYTDRVVLAQNRGTSTWTGKVAGYPPGNNYMLQLTLAGNPDQKFAQSQGFWIKPNGTAMPQQVVGAGAGAAPGSPAAPGAAGMPGGTTANGEAGGAGGTAGGAVTDPNAVVPGVVSAAGSLSTSAGLLAGLLLAAVGITM